MRRIYLKLIVLILVLSVFSCGAGDGFKTESYDRIESITASNLRRLDDIKIVFTQEVKYKDKAKKAIIFTPSLDGSYSFVDEKTFVFHPSSPYKGEEEINMRVDIGLLFDGKADEIGFEKNFIVSPPSLFVNLMPINLGEDKDSIEIEGEIETDIPYKIEEIKNAFTLSREDGKDIGSINLEISPNRGDLSYSLFIKGIKKEEKDFNFLVQYDGSVFGAADKNVVKYTVLSKNSFEAVSYQVEDGNTIGVYFSDLIEQAQDFATYFSVESQSEFTYSVQQKDNKIKLYNNIGSWPDNCKVTVFRGIKSKSGNLSKKDYVFSIKDSWDIPTVKFETRGNIVPSKENATVLIKTHNIKGIYMRAVNIYGHNMLQFLQNENLGDGHYLEPVGETVWEGKFEFEWQDDMKNRDVVRAIDITELVKKFPTGIFNLQIAFSKEDSMYKPKNPQDDFSHLPFPKSKFYTYYWLATGEYFNENEGKVTKNAFWRQRENPSHPAFYLPSYNYELIARKDILVSNIALMAKKDVAGSVYARVCDIRTGRAVPGVEVLAFTFAQRELNKKTTDKEGFVVFESVKDVAFIQASKDNSVAYLKLLEGSEIATGHFAVDGEMSKEGVKGYIYGERGVWRPGDDIHLNFILQDAKNTLPKDIPVEFTLLDPLSVEVDHKVFNSSVGGIYRMDSKTSRQAKTGTYVARVRIGGNVWTKSIRVESIIPNRLFVELEPKGILKTGQNNIKLYGQWLHGAKASGLKAEVDCSYSLNNKPFHEWKDYSFVSDNEKNRFLTSTEHVWQGFLNDDGIANMNIGMNVANAPGKLKVKFETRIYESSGVFSVENKVFDFSPYSAYVGIMLPEGRDAYRERMLYTNNDNTIDIVVVDSEGKLLGSKRSCQVELYRLGWRWWWEYDAYESESLYSASSSIKSVISNRVEVKNGRGKWTFNINDEDWGRYLLIVKDENSGHSCSSVLYLDNPYWARRASDEVGIAETILQIQSGKDKYNVGEDVEVSFPSAKDSFAYITLERAGCVLESKVIEGTGNICKYSFKATKKMAPNVYIHISLVQPYKNVINSLPIRLYGIMPVKIEDKHTRLEPIIIAQDSFESNARASFKVKEKSGRAMAFTVAVVDEGLLGLTGFKQANPWNHFYRKEASTLGSYDMFNYVSGAFGGRIESLLAVGGSDEEVGGDGSKKAERFKSVAMLLGPYELGVKEEKTIEFDMPQYMGSVRLMLVATEGLSYGMKEETVKVASPLIVLPTFPRSFGLSENIEIPVTVFNNTDSHSSVKVSLKAEGAINLKLEKSVDVPPMKSAVVGFNVKSEKKGKSIFTVEGFGSRGIKDKAVVEIDSIFRGSPYVSVANVLVGENKEEDINISLPGEKDTRELYLEVSRLPSLGIENRLSYLLEKPSGFLERLISKAFSQLYLPAFLELDDEEAQRRKDDVSFVLKNLPTFQTSVGGFSCWPSGREDSLWVSIYAGHFMCEAKKKGFTVEDSLYKKFLEYSSDLAKNWNVGYMNDPDLQAYRLYVLSLAGRSELQAMNKLKAVNSLSPLAKSLLGAAYIVLGKKDVGKTLVEDVSLSFVQNQQGLKNYGSAVRDVAMKLQAYTLLEEKGNKVNECIQVLANISSCEDYLSTNEIAWIFIALSPYYSNKKDSVVFCDLFVVGEKQEVTLNKTSRVVRLKVGDEDMQDIRVKNRSDEPVYISVTAKSILKKEEEKSYSYGGLSLNVAYKRINGAAIGNSYSIKKGDRFLIFVETQNNSGVRLEDLVLSLPIPTGWEFSNKRISDDDFIEDIESTSYDYQDITDTSIYTYFSLDNSSKKTFIFEGTAVYGGEYHVPSIRLDSMYDPNRRAAVKN